MPVVIAAKGKDFFAWRAAADFAMGLRQTVLERVEPLLSHEAAAVIEDMDGQLARQVREYEQQLATFQEIISRVEQAEAPEAIVADIADFYRLAYGFLAGYRSAGAFYRLSHRLVTTVCAAGVRYARARAGADRLPGLAVLGLGACGRTEFSPYSSLKLLLVHDETGRDGLELVERFGIYFNGFIQQAGIAVDGEISVCNPGWAGSVPEWRQRVARYRVSGEPDEKIDMLRIADHCVIHDENGLAARFRGEVLPLMAQDWRMLDHLIHRLKALPAPLGLLGGLKMERGAGNRKLFRLLDLAIVPFSLCITALAVMHGIESATTPSRIRELLTTRHLNVEKSEELLQAWHLINEQRLLSEAMGKDVELDGVCIDLDVLGDEEEEALRRAMETLADLQRHVAISFNDLRG